MPASLCLVMIVKDEAAILERCLHSVKALISHWVICDTGSTDGTQALIRRTLRDIPGELYEDRWVNFGHNRTLGLQRARGRADYHLLIDADMVVNLRQPLSRLTADAYLIAFTGWCDYSVIRLVSDRHEWIYRGVTHEHVHSDTATKVEKLQQLTVTHHEDGSSRRDKYERDIVLLQESLRAEPDQARSVYYLAQSYRDTQQYQKALAWYEKRALMAGWEEESWHAAYQVGNMQALLHGDWRVVLNTYLQAYNFRPSRLEPIYHIANFYREQGQHPLAYHFARLVEEVSYPEDILFVERDIYEFRLPLEYAMACQGTGRVAEATRAYGRVLALQNLPAVWRQAATEGQESLKSLAASPTD